jgi:hypothetical protein
MSPGARLNRIACDFFHRGIVPDVLPEPESAREIFGLGSPDGSPVALIVCGGDPRIRQSRESNRSTRRQ